MADRPAAPPLRVAVLGASATVETSWHGGPRADLAYPRVLEAELLAAGVPATVAVHALPANRIRHGRADWIERVARWDPDVAVLHFGQADNVHLFLPRWAERHANSPRRRSGPVRDRYRRRVVRPLWIGAAKLQQRLDPRLGPRSVGRRQRKQADELLDLVRLVLATSQATVLLPDLLRPGPPWASWFPAAAARMAHFNECVAQRVAALDDPRVRVFPLAAIVEGAMAPDEEPAPDGGHFTPRAHRLIGSALADAVLYR
jgi:hypothetical protein